MSEEQITNEVKQPKKSIKNFSKKKGILSCKKEQNAIIKIIFRKNLINLF